MRPVYRDWLGTDEANHERYIMKQTVYARFKTSDTMGTKWEDIEATEIPFNGDYDKLRNDIIVAARVLHPKEMIEVRYSFGGSYQGHYFEVDAR